jgi:predicted Zn finger-like uncharacterized protein
MAGLAARCTACSTVFRVVPDQLRVAGGYVRCGRCSGVFNAAETLLDLDTGLPTRLGAPEPSIPVPDPAPEPAVEPTPEPVAQAEPEPEPEPEAAPELPGPELADFELVTPDLAEPELRAEPTSTATETAPIEAGTDFDLEFLPAPLAPEPEAEPEAAAQPFPDAAASAFELDIPQPEGETSAVAASEAPWGETPAAATAHEHLRIDYVPQAAAEPISIELTLPPATPDAQPQVLTLQTAPAEMPPLQVEPGDKPSFVRSAERAERWEKPQLRVGLIAACAAASLLLAGQAVFTWRDQIVARWPGTRPIIEPPCVAFGCRIEAPHAIESLAIESSGLVRVEKSSVYKLQVTMRNRSGQEVAVPALDLTLSDAQGKPLARRVLRATDLGVNMATLPAGRELAMQATLQAQLAGGEPVSGYTIDPFYP